MFIMTNIAVNQDLVQVYDTKDGSNDTVRLSVVADQIKMKKLKVYGLGRLSDKYPKDAQALYSYGLYVSINESKEALATHYSQMGVPRNIARAKVGLV